MKAVETPLLLYLMYIATVSHGWFVCPVANPVFWIRFDSFQLRFQRFILSSYFVVKSFLILNSLFFIH